MESVNVNYDYIELLAFDIHNIPRGRIIAKRKLKSILSKGIGLPAAICFHGFQEERNYSDYFYKGRNFNNIFFVPVLHTLVDVPKIIRGDNNVGQIICDLRQHDGTIEPTHCRYIAQSQLNKLASMGLSLKSSFEIEFMILDENNAPWGHTKHLANLDIMSENQEVFIELMSEMNNSGVKCDAVHPEWGAGQYEVTLDLTEGIQAADMLSRFKCMSKTFFKKKNLNAVYMPKLNEKAVTNGFHFNLSIWTAADGENAFFDSKRPGKLSTLGKQWLAGLIKHTPAMTAILCPTTNCYRRLHKPNSPSKCDWTDGRYKSFRLVAETDGNTYLEVRIPSSASNPYLTMAAILAAGMDGVEQGLSLESVNQEKELPKDLDTALDVLRADEYMVESLGHIFVEQFAYIKRLHEINVFKEMACVCDEELFEKEREMYMYRA